MLAPFLDWLSPLGCKTPFICFWGSIFPGSVRTEKRQSPWPSGLFLENGLLLSARL
jgi:hypothetical protein